MTLADELIKKGVLKSSGLIEAFRAVDRKYFVPGEMEKYAYSDEPLPIGKNQTISQPWTVAFMLELLEPKHEENILEIGYGSGWQTALLSHIGANVYAIERIPELCEFGKCNVGRFLETSEKRQKSADAKFFCQDGTRGLPDIAKTIGGFDKVIAAAAGEQLPNAWQEQLKIGGRMVVPIQNHISLFIKTGDNQLNEQQYPGFAFVPLVEEK